ncbi:MAG: hypothetical protein MJA30_03240 [Cytophagales bacterium]|nr:hypothetical protein [Cytophagales bacterium]
MKSKLYLLIFLVLVQISCEDDVRHIQPTAEVINVFPFAEQRGYVGEFLAQPIVLQVTTLRDAIPVVGAQVKLDVVEGSVDFEENEFLTDVNGLVLIRLKPLSSTNIVLNASVVDTDINRTINVQVSEGRNSKITIIGGNAQYGLPGDLLSECLQIRVTDDFDKPSKNAAAVFKLVEGDGKFENEQNEIIVPTDEDGYACASFTMGSSSNINAIEVTVDGDTTVLFSQFTLLEPAITALTTVNDQVTITWTENLNYDFNKYVITRHTGTWGDWDVIAEITDENITSYIDNTALYNLIYDYKVAVMLNEEINLESEARSIGVGSFIHLDDGVGDFVISTPRNALYVSMPGMNHINAYDLESLELIRTLVIPSEPLGLEIDERNNQLFVALSGSGEVAVIDLDTFDYSKINVFDALGSHRITQLQLGNNDNFLFGVGHTGSGSLTYLIRINLDDQSVIRFHNQVTRDVPDIALSNDNIFVNNGEDHLLFKLDYNTGARIDVIGSLRDLEGFHKKAVLQDQEHLVLGSGQIITIDGFQLATDLFTRGIPFIPATSHDYFYYLTFDRIKKIDSDTYELIDEIEIGANLRYTRSILRREFEVHGNEDYFVIPVDWRTLNIVPNAMKN